MRLDSLIICSIPHVPTPVLELCFSELHSIECEFYFVCGCIWRNMIACSSCKIGEHTTYLHLMGRIDTLCLRREVAEECVDHPFTPEE